MCLANLACQTVRNLAGKYLMTGRLGLESVEKTFLVAIFMSSNVITLSSTMWFLMLRFYSVVCMIGYVVCGNSFCE